ncbi:MAG: alpha/beta hydrolase [Selenomonadaceae bacterium]|nr:alpha/beta hydrolase [Selenomonadaceae bacterium]
MSNVSERELQTRGVIHTEFGEDLSWEYFSYVKNHPIKWSTPTEILYGSEDNLTTAETIKKFAEKIGAGLTIMDGGEHWFHTEEQMKFLDKWLIARI